MTNYFPAIPTLIGVLLEESFVLDIIERGGQVVFRLDAVLTPDHRAYHPPGPGEQYCMTPGVLIFDEVWAVEWLTDHTHRRVREPHGEDDLGNIDSLVVEDGTYTVEGEWGRVRIHSTARPTFRIPDEMGTVTSTDWMGRSPLHYFAIDGKSKAVRDAIARGAIVDARDHVGATPLQLASRGGHLATMTALLDAGADTELGDDKGRTPLFWATNATNWFEAIALLRDRGADPTATAYKSYFGDRSVLDLVRQSMARGDHHLVPAFRDLL